MEKLIGTLNKGSENLDGLKLNKTTKNSSRDLACNFKLPTREYYSQNFLKIDKVFPIFKSEDEAFNFIINYYYLFKTDSGTSLSYTYLLGVLEKGGKCNNINVTKLRFRLNSYELYQINKEVFDYVSVFHDQKQLLDRLLSNQKKLVGKCGNKLSLITIIGILQYCGKLNGLKVATIKVEVSSYVFYIDNNRKFAKLILDNLGSKFNINQLKDLLNKTYKDKNNIWKSTKTGKLVSNSYRFRIINYILNDYFGTN